MSDDTRCMWCDAPATDHAGTRDAHCDAHREWPTGVVCEICRDVATLSALITGDPWRADA